MEVAVAERVVTVCDIDPTEISAGHVRLDVAGEVRELDLCANHLGQLQTALSAFGSPAASRARRGRPPRAAGRGRPKAAAKAAAKPAKTAKAAKAKPAAKAAAKPAAKAPAARRGRRAVASASRTLPRARTGNISAPVPTSEVRKWARANGHTVNTRGRLSEDLIKQYLASAK
jgi:hypothetical protein